jgi:hypothetical protein
MKLKLAPQLILLLCLYRALSRLTLIGIGTITIVNAVQTKKGNIKTPIIEYVSTDKS